MNLPPVPVGLPRVVRRADGKVFRVLAREPLPDGPVDLIAAEGPPFEGARIDGRTFGQDYEPEKITGPGLGDLARVAFEAYGASTGGKTWDGDPLPSFDQIRLRAPRVAEAWEAAVGAVLAALENSR